MPGSCPNTLSSPEKERQSCGIMEKVHKRLPFFVTKKEKHTEETSIKQKNKNNALTSVEFYRKMEFRFSVCSLLPHCLLLVCVCFSCIYHRTWTVHTVGQRKLSPIIWRSKLWIQYGVVVLSVTIVVFAGCYKVHYVEFKKPQNLILKNRIYVPNLPLRLVELWQHLNEWMWMSM